VWWLTYSISTIASMMCPPANFLFFCFCEAFLQFSPIYQDIFYVFFCLAFIQYSRAFCRLVWSLVWQYCAKPPKGCRTVRRHLPSNHTIQNMTLRSLTTHCLTLSGPPAADKKLGSSQNLLREAKQNMDICGIG
jgi:hypothetical protein